MKKILMTGVLILLLLGTCARADAELLSYEKDRGYDYAALGSYPYEADGTEMPVLWRVLSANNGQAVLLTEYIIDTKQVIFENNQKVIENHTFRRIAAYDESDLYVWLNTECLDRLFKDDPLRGTLIEVPGLGKLFPLPQEEYMNVANGFESEQFSVEDLPYAFPRRQCTGTPYVLANTPLYVDNRNEKSPYWCVSIKSPSDYRFGLVGNNGHISWGAYTNIKVGGLRLAIRLDLSLLEIASGAGTRENPYLLRYTGPDTAFEPDTASAANLTAKPTAAPTPVPTPRPTAKPTAKPTVKPTVKPTARPTAEPTPVPTAEPTLVPTAEPTEKPTPEPTAEPTPELTAEPTGKPTAEPTPEATAEPTAEPTPEATAEPTAEPTPEATAEPTAEPTPVPTAEPTEKPTPEPTAEPTEKPTAEPTPEPTAEPTEKPTAEPTPEATAEPTTEPTVHTTEKPTAEPTSEPTEKPTSEPTVEPTEKPTPEPTEKPTAEPTPAPTEKPAPDPTEAPTEAAEEKSGVTISLIGDCSIGDSIQYIGSETSYHAAIKKNGLDWPFSLVRDYLLQDDLTVANLEVVFTNRQKHSDKVFNLVADLDFVQVLVKGGIDIVNTVNNHCMDFLEGGYQDTLTTLERANIRYFGTIYPGQANGHDDLGIMEAGGVWFGFVGFSYPQDADLKRIASRISKLKEEAGCDIVIVSLHWGRETYMTPESWQLTYARQVIDAGADVVYGHHPHVLQPIQFYQGRPIFYSTGNFTFGTMSKVDPSTGIFQLTFERTGAGVELKELRVIPCETQGSPDYRPFELTDAEERRKVFGKLVFKREYSKAENPPASFLESGIVRFENGRMLP